MFNKENLNQLSNLLIKQKQNVAVAENATAGMMQLAFANATYSTQFFEGGITTYNLLQKWRLLQVDETHAKTCNCVSDQVAEDMAQGVCKLFGTDWGIGITAYTAPIAEKGVEGPFAHMALVYKGRVVLKRSWLAATEEVTKVQSHYVDKTIEAFLAYIKTKELVEMVL